MVEALAWAVGVRVSSGGEMGAQEAQEVLLAVWYDVVRGNPDTERRASSSRMTRKPDSP